MKNYDSSFKTKVYLQVLALCTVLFCALTSHATYANKVGVWPINPVIEYNQKNSKISVRNLDAKNSVRLQVRVMQWTQDGQKDIFTPQKDIVISPPQIQVKPSAEQLFRVIVRNALPQVGHETAYRIIIEEIPIPQSLAREAVEVSINMRYSLPLLILHQEKATPIPEQIAEVEKGVSYTVSSEGPSITLSNQSQWLQRMSKVKILDANQAELMTIADGLWGYTLPKGGRSFSLTSEQYEALKNNSNSISYTYDEHVYRIFKKQ